MSELSGKALPQNSRASAVNTAAANTATASTAAVHAAAAQEATAQEATAQEAPAGGRAASTPNPQNEAAVKTLVNAAGLTFLLTGFLGRLPAAFNQLGMLLIVATSGRGLAAAGATVAAVGLGTALGAPLVGRAVDKFGPVRVLWAAIAAQTAALLGVLTALHTQAPTPALLSCAALLGAANPQVSSIARACWSSIAHRTPGAAAQRTIKLGFGFETAADETSFVVGPLVAGLLVTLLGPTGAATALLACTITLEGTFALWLALHKNVHAAQQSREATGRAPLNIRASIPPLLAIYATGTVFGATQTALTAINQAAKLDALTGPMYGAMGITSALAGLLIPALSWQWRTKLLLGGALIAASSVAVAGLPGTFPTLLLLLLMGIGVGITLTTSYTRLEELAAGGRITTIMTIGATCLVLGVSTGSLTAGMLGGNLHLTNAAAVAAGLVVIAVGGLRKRA